MLSLEYKTHTELVCSDLLTFIPSNSQYTYIYDLHQKKDHHTFSFHTLERKTITLLGQHSQAHTLFVLTKMCKAPTCVVLPRRLR